MVGHSGNFEATVKAIEALDECVGRLQKVCAEENVTMILTADHGNADQMTYDDGGKHTSHSEAEVPLIVIHPKLYDQNIMVNQDNKIMALKDVAPTVLKILNINKPQEFTGQSVFV
jgi:2,3-bisphosphoglycerate-independent phosphoglycerate mutase